MTWEKIMEIAAPYVLAVSLVAGFFTWIKYTEAESLKEEAAILYRKMESMEFVARIPAYPSFPSQKLNLTLNTNAKGFQVVLPNDKAITESLDFKTLDEVIEYFQGLK